MAKGPESKVQQWAKEYLLRHLPNAYIRKIHQSQFSHKGIPDLLICNDGLFAGLEVKTETGKLTKLQEIELGLIENAGGISIVLYGKDKDTMDKLIQHLTI